MKLTKENLEFKEGDDEPLDGDSVDRLVNILRAKLNLIEGNITHEEYMKMQL